MRKVILISIGAVIAVVCTSCSQQKDTKVAAESVAAVQSDTASPAAASQIEAPPVPVGAENFKKLVAYIEKNGTVVFIRCNRPVRLAPKLP